MRRVLSGFVLGVMLTVGLLLSVVAFAQDDILSLVRPLVVDVRQSVPIVADVVVPLENGENVTATVPLTLDIALQVAVSGVVSESVEVVEETEPEVEVGESSAGAELTAESENKVNYTVSAESDERLTVLSVEPLRTEQGDFAVEVALEVTDPAEAASVEEVIATVKCYGERNTSLCGVSQMLRLNPDDNYVGYIETTAPFEDVQWVEIGWKAD